MVPLTKLLPDRKQINLVPQRFKFNIVNICCSVLVVYRNIYGSKSQLCYHFQLISVYNLLNSDIHFFLCKSHTSMNTKRTKVYLFQLTCYFVSFYRIKQQSFASIYSISDDALSTIFFHLY